MKTSLVAASILAVGALVYGANVRPQAGNPKDDRPAPSAGRTRIALINLGYVVKHYEKFKTFQQEIKDAVQPFQKRDADMKARGEALAKQLQDPNLEADKKPEIEKKLRQLQRKLEDNNVEAKQLIGKKSDEHTRTLYEDVEKAARRYAAGHGIDLVLQYNEATTDEELHSTANITRKLQAGALIPLHAASGIDVSKQLVEALNDDLNAE